MCITDGKIDCIIDPISNAIYNVLYPFFAWIIETIIGIFEFIYNIGLLFGSIVTLISGAFSDMFAVNPYAATFLSLIFMGISISMFLRIYNIIAGTEIWGFKLPKL